MASKPNKKNYNKKNLLKELELILNELATQIRMQKISGESFLSH